jgi:hypothetical protein
MTLFNAIGLYIATHPGIDAVTGLLGIGAVSVAISYRRRPDRANIIRLRPRRRRRLLKDL